MPSLTPLLMGPLSVRPVLLFETNDPTREDEAFVKGLNQALDYDIEQGGLTQEELDRMLAVCTSCLVAPRVHALEHLAFGRPTAWPLPGEPWQEPVIADGRERLLARLLHQGANPWREVPVDLDNRRETSYSSEALRGATVASTLLAHGYLRVFDRALDLPQANGQSMDQHGPRRGYKEYPKNGLTLLQEAVWQHDELLARKLIERGASVQGALRFAQSGRMASYLIEQGADPKEIHDKMDVSAYWVKHRSGKMVRDLMKSLENDQDPHDRLMKALQGGQWSTVSDALDAYPGWENVRLPVGMATVSIPVALLMKADKEKDRKAIPHMLKMLERMGLPTHEALPCVPESVMARLAITHLLKEPFPNVRARKTLETLNEKLHQARLWLYEGMLYGEQDLKEDGQCLVDCASAFYGTVEGANMAMAALSGPLPSLNPTTNEYGLSPAVDKPLTQAAHVIGALCRLAMMSGRLGIYNSYHEKLFSNVFMGRVNEVLNAAPAVNRLPFVAYRRLLDRAHADQQEALQDDVVALWCFALAFRHNPGNSVDPWTQVAAIAKERWDRGHHLASWSAQEMKRFLELADFTRKPSTQVFCEAFKVEYEQKALEASTLQRPARARARL